MGSKQVRLDEDVYARIQDEKRDDETFSDAVDRLTSNWSLAGWARKQETDPDESASHRELLDDLNEIDRQEAAEILERLE